MGAPNMNGGGGGGGAGPLRKSQLIYSESSDLGK